ncbi:MAG: hypothetical protein LH471_08035 [Salinibacterium sp.]|nr:hypothetical protein [Salinibacterium sp.]
MRTEATVELRGMTLTIDLDEHPVQGAAMSARDDGSVEGRARVATITTADGFRATIGVCTWPAPDGDGDADIRLLDFWAGADDYRRLERAGKMSLAAAGERRVGILRAMAYGEHEWPTLQTVGWEALDRLAGKDAGALLRQHGALSGAVGELNPAAKRFKDAPGFSIGDDPTAAFVAFAITRVMPIASGFGKPGLEPLHV